MVRMNTEPVIKRTDPADIAQELIREYGLPGAMDEATREGLEAQAAGRLYDLSIWREVKKFLREQRDETLS